MADSNNSLGLTESDTAIDVHKEVEKESERGDPSSIPARAEPHALTPQLFKDYSLQVLVSRKSWSNPEIEPCEPFAAWANRKSVWKVFARLPADMSHNTVWNMQEAFRIKSLEGYEFKFTQIQLAAHPSTLSGVDRPLDNSCQFEWLEYHTKCIAKHDTAFVLSRGWWFCCADATE